MYIMQQTCNILSRIYIYICICMHVCIYIYIAVSYAVYLICRCLVFDDSFEHEVQHDGERPRTVHSIILNHMISYNILYYNVT